MWLYTQKRFEQVKFKKMVLQTDCDVIWIFFLSKLTKLKLKKQRLPQNYSK